MAINAINNKTYLLYNNEPYVVPGDASFTRSAAWETVERRSTDSTHTAQAITILRNHGRQPHTCQLSFTVSKATTDAALYDAIADYETLVGKEVRVVYSGAEFGQYVVADASISLVVDGAMGITRATIAYNLRESTVNTSQAVSNVRTL